MQKLPIAKFLGVTTISQIPKHLYFGRKIFILTLHTSLGHHPHYHPRMQELRRHSCEPLPPWYLRSSCKPRLRAYNGHVVHLS